VAGVRVTGREALRSGTGSHDTQYLLLRGPLLR